MAGPHGRTSCPMARWRPEVGKGRALPGQGEVSAALLPRLKMPWNLESDAFGSPGHPHMGYRTPLWQTEECLKNVLVTGLKSQSKLCETPSKKEKKRKISQVVFMSYFSEPTNL